MKIIEKVLKYQLRFKNIVYYSQAYDKYYLCDFNGDLIRTIEVDDCHWFYQDENFLQIGNNGKLGYFYKNVFVKQLYNYYRPIVNSIGVATDYTNSDGRTHKETLFRLPQEQQILSEWLPDSIFHIQDQYWCNDTTEDFKLIDADSGEILWKIAQPKVEKPYEYNGLTNIKKVLGIYKENLWLQLPDSRLWAVDIKTGKINNEIEHEYFCIHEDCIFLKKGMGEIIILGFDLYACFVIDELKFVKDFMLPDFIRINKSTLIFDNEVAFTGMKDNSFYPNVYGIFNRGKLSFEFIGEQLSEDGFFYQEPQVNDELFTILDSEGNLIIHKMQEIIMSKN